MSNIDARSCAVEIYGAGLAKAVSFVAPRVIDWCEVRNNATGLDHIDVTLEVAGPDGPATCNILLVEATPEANVEVLRQCFEDGRPVIAHGWRLLTDHPRTKRPWLQGVIRLLSSGPEPVN